MRNNRPATADTVKCPLCGHGSLERVELVSRLHDSEFNRILQNYIDEVTYGAMQPRDMLAADTIVTTRFASDTESSRRPADLFMVAKPENH